jgi:hypothetical protein
VVNKIVGELVKSQGSVVRGTRRRLAAVKLVAFRCRSTRANEFATNGITCTRMDMTEDLAAMPRRTVREVNV